MTRRTLILDEVALQAGGSGGTQSVIYRDAARQYVLKVNRKHSSDGRLVTHRDAEAFATHAARDACFVRKLQHLDWAPRLLCGNAFAMVFTDVGAALKPSRLLQVTDAHAQVSRILADLHALGIKHNDLVKMQGHVFVQAMEQLSSITAPSQRRRTRLSQPSAVDIHHCLLAKLEVQPTGSGCRRKLAWLFSSELTEKDGRISVVDFGWASTYGNFSFEGQVANQVPTLFAAAPPRDDRDIMPLMSLWRMVAESTDARHRDLELHLIVFWNATDARARSSYEEALATFKTSIITTQMHIAYESSGERIDRLTAFYQNNLPKGFRLDDDRGKVPFLVIYLKLDRRQYGQCSGGASARGMRACPPTHAFKNAARRKYALVVHTTDTVNETVDNLKALGISYQAAVQLQRPHWSCIEEVLQALDTVCTYVLMRDFEPYTAGSRPPREVDLLVSNFKQAQVVLGGVPASAPWQMVGSGGNHSSFSVIVAGKAVKFDVRHVGDGYMDMDQAWAERVLRRRVFHPVNRFYVPSPHDQVSDREIRRRCAVAP